MHKPPSEVLEYKTIAIDPQNHDKHPTNCPQTPPTTRAFLRLDPPPAPRRRFVVLLQSYAPLPHRLRPRQPLATAISPGRAPVSFQSNKSNKLQQCPFIPYPSKMAPAQGIRSPGAPEANQRALRKRTTSGKTAADAPGAPPTCVRGGPKSISRHLGWEGRG